MFFIKSYIASGDIKLAFIKGDDLCPDTSSRVMIYDVLIL
jgi:hypothetical protein